MNNLNKIMGMVKKISEPFFLSEMHCKPGIQIRLIKKAEGRKLHKKLRNETRFMILRRYRLACKEKQAYQNLLLSEKDSFNLNVPDFSCGHGHQGKTTITISLCKGE